MFHVSDCPSVKKKIIKEYSFQYILDFPASTKKTFQHFLS